MSQQPRLCLVQSWQSVSRPPSRNCATSMISHPGMLQVSSQVHFGFRLTYFLPWVLPCLQVSQVFIFLLAVHVQWFPGEQRQMHLLEHTWGWSRSSVYELPYPWRHQLICRQGHQNMTTTTSKRVASWITVEGRILDATNARGRLLTTERQNKVAISRKSTDDESNFGDLGYEVTARLHEDRIWNKEGVSCAEETTQGRTWSTQTSEWVAVGTGTTGGATCTREWNVLVQVIDPS